MTETVMDQKESQEYSFFVSYRTPAPFNVGLVLHLQAASEHEQAHRFPVYLAGWVHPHQLIVHHMHYDAQALALPIATDLVARYPYQGQVYGFNTKLFHKQNEPLDLWFLEYPKRIDVKNLRQSSRIPITMEVKTPDNEILFTRDISTHGASLMANPKSGEPTHQIGDSMELSFTLPDHTIVENLSASVVRIYSEHKHQMVGVKFDENDFQAMASISQYLVRFEKDFFDF